jgi:serine/threonine-protein kinase
MVPVAMSDDPRVGSRLVGRYEIRRVVADGGMGRVYEGVDKQADVRVAVKVLHDDVARDEVSLERFKREYEISGLLPHDYIVSVTDFQRDPVAGVWLLVMEYLDGEELRIVLKRTRVLPPVRVIRMLSQIALGLDEAHARHFVHRDLKPDNIFLCGTRDGDVVKLLDFGSVKDKNKDAKKLTVLGTTIGSPYYMAPEQAQGLDTLDARADVFALAAITYECVTGHVPFDGTNGPSILLSILTKDPIPPTKRGAGGPFPIPPALDEVLEVALMKNPGIRTRTVGELADAVGRAYGLTGDHREWARVPSSTLEKICAESLRQATQPRGTPVIAQADPFASPAPHGGAPAGPPGPAPAEMMQQAFETSRQAEYAEPGAAGLPATRPPWVIAAIVGLAALLLGGGIALAFVVGR